jgi:hypothetical protein
VEEKWRRSGSLAIIEHEIPELVWGWVAIIMERTPNVQTQYEVEQGTAHGGRRSAAGFMLGTLGILN